MSKAKKTKAPNRKTALDRATARLRVALRRETKNIIEIGNILIEIRDKHLEHGEWKPWLAENFSLSYQSALNYCGAAQYVERKQKSQTVGHFDFANLSASVLYWLAAGHYDEQEEAAILAATRERRVDEDAADAICDALAPPDDDPPDDTDDGSGDDGGDDATAEDPEIEAILAAGADPAVPPPAPNPPPTDFSLLNFEAAIGSLKRLMTKPAAEFAGTINSANDLEHVADFIRAVAGVRRQ